MRQFKVLQRILHVGARRCDVPNDTIYSKACAVEHS
ncbi:hypothetical protein GGE07_004534 [Sinorhizobium terangae]|nr:hypothetical protein [Sinorhizobium terangae]